ETVLGSKVGEKLAAFDEEKLLFTLIVGSATERLYCLYQRSDDTGRALEPSWYLAELERALSSTTTEITKPVIPRSIRAKKDVEPFRSSDFLLPEELAIRLSLEGEDPESLLNNFPSTKALYRPGSQLLDFLEDANGKLSPYDGVIGHLPEYWRDLCQHGVSPTALERYARCPSHVAGRWLSRSSCKANSRVIGPLRRRTCRFSARSIGSTLTKRTLITA